MITTYTNLSDFDYLLPEKLIAKEPTISRDTSRLLIYQPNINSNCIGIFKDLHFHNIIDFIKPHDLLVFNNSKVIKARLFGNKITGGKIEILVERILNKNIFTCHIRSNKTIPVGLLICLPHELKIKVIKKVDGLFAVETQSEVDLFEYFEENGCIPLPPYINRHSNKIDETRYQTVYAKDYGSVAAPTAGLHFTQQLLDQIENKGAKLAYVTLHVGSGTFKPVSVENINEHKMHSEVYHIPQETIDLIKQSKQNGGRIIAVGTTSLRTLETCAQNNFKVNYGETDIFITPGYKFKIVDKLITNFHLPKSTLLMLVSAFAGYDEIKTIYQHAITNEYRFFSYGDALLLTRKD